MEIQSISYKAVTSKAVKNNAKATIDKIPGRLTRIQPQKTRPQERIHAPIRTNQGQDGLPDNLGGYSNLEADTNKVPTAAMTPVKVDLEGFPAPKQKGFG